MQRRVNQFTLEPINNILQGSIFGVSSIIPQPSPPPLDFSFILMNGINFGLMDGQDFLLMKTI